MVGESIRLSRQGGCMFVDVDVVLALAVWFDWEDFQTLPFAGIHM